MPTIQVKRGTRAQINAAALANGLKIGEVYLITDEGRIAIGTGLNTYQDFAKLSEAGGGGSSGVNIQDFTTPGTSTWTKPAGAQWIELCIWGGGSGGGGGRSGVNTTSGGGAGGMSGRHATFRFMASTAGATETVTVGAGGFGGDPDPSLGLTGLGGGYSAFGNLFVLDGGSQTNGGGTGTAAATSDTFSTAFTTTNHVWVTSGVGAAGQAATVGGTARINRAAAGGGGGSGSNATAGYNGGAGGSGSYQIWYSGMRVSGTQEVGGGGTAGVVGGTLNGGNGASNHWGGSGGGGGAGARTGNAGNGGNGGYPGGGGGGGGGAYNGTGGRGGNGAAGRVLVVTYF